MPSQALQASKYEDWFWKEAMGKCYFRLGLFRDAEGMFKSALKQQETIDLYLALAKVTNYLQLGHKLHCNLLRHNVPLLRRFTFG